ncbi:hypothetical protein NESM_000444100 [Novymonas esmeraldas]|uniref:Uncharacterized protein n=1 Tax=Novymonas esmeraldas TaxID=1808958 RepID=A0AAW0ELX5_9TRYP
MLRRVTCTAAAAPSASPVAAKVSGGLQGPTTARSYTIASLLAQCRAPHTAPPHQHQRRLYTSRSGEDKVVPDKDKQAAAAAAASTTPSAAATTAVQFFAVSETPNTTTTATSTTTAAAHLQSPQEQKAAAAAVAATAEGKGGAAASTSGVRTIGIKLAEDEELVRAFNNFTASVNGCTQEEFLVGAKQAYYSLAVVISAFAEHAQQPFAGRTESTKTIAAAHEAAKLLDNAFKPEKRADAAAAAAAAVAAVASASAAGQDGASSTASPKTKLQESLVQSVVSTITDLLPVSRHLAESIFNIWMLQAEKQVNLASVASPSDYVLDSKLVIFARLDQARMYFNSHQVGAEVDVTFDNDYLRTLTPATSDVDAGMIEVHTDTDANARRTTPEAHTFVVNKSTRTLTPTNAAAAKAMAAPADVPGNHNADDVAQKAAPTGATSRVHVTCAGSDAGTADTTAAAAATSAAATATGEETHSVYIKVNGNTLPPIPASARACALLTVDVVVPPERYAYNFEWFYKRIVGYENDYERIAAARVFASNSPTSLASFLDFVMRMVTGKPVEFMFTKSIGRMIGIPEDVSETPPATRKLMCMYMDQSYKWVLADLVTLAPVVEAKLPKV